MIERIHLAIVREVERQGSLTAAAQRLCLTQSALSHTMRKLEQRVGTPVWRREGKRLVLTQAGQALLAVAQRVLPQLELAEERLQQYARGERGTLRIGMECHPCFLWLHRHLGPYLARWPDVDVDVRQRFQFGGMGALLAHDIDVLVTPDPLLHAQVHFEPVFDYEQVLVVSAAHRLAAQSWAQPEDLAGETLLTYPVSTDRLDVYTRFLTPAGVLPLRHKTVENTEVLLQMVAAGRAVTAMPAWLVQEYAQRLPLAWLRLGQQGVFKHIHLGVRRADRGVDYVADFLRQCRAAEA
ncbi:MAG: LysR family transcriptional regulator [Caldimonas sp.]|uniref:LysR family transcriptional regulator n=1 Tax=Caldimonas taiwanensis TaxID=307483 RepID=UPI000783FD2D|nr:LysR family transcriptional regulator [Caldimonas taiwanensis]GIX23271.1 MAG: LysR family transcriptional regulator [Caldimonas sp.]